MDKLIEVVKKLQRVFSSTNIGDLNTEIQLPQIVVIGAQSSGKSSVLEGIVGKEFLPRGTGIVTRRPLILHLNLCEPNDPLRSKYSEVGPETDFAIFEHKPNQIFVRFNEVYEEIEADTDRVAGINKGICPKPITLSIYSHKVVHLSLVDLPGIVKNRVGDQPTDIEAQIHDIIMDYIRNPNSIILAVSEANVDIANSDAIKLAQEVDPKKERTLAVLTKLDMMGKGTDAMKELTGKIIPFRRGIIGVINRNQEDIDNKKEIEACWEDEKQFLQQKYPSIAHQNGIKYLAQTLHKNLLEHIDKCLPKLRARIIENIGKCENELQQLGHTIIDPKAKLLDLNNRFVRAYNETIMGTGDGMDMIKNLRPQNELFGGAKISWIFNYEYAHELDGINLAEELKIEYIHQAVIQTEGLHPSIIVPEKCFKALSSQQIKHLVKPSLKCADLVHEEMRKAIGYCGNEALKHEFGRFPELSAKIYNFVRHMLEERTQEAKKFIEESIGAHAGFINTKHPDFSSERPLLMRLVKLDPDVFAMAQQRSIFHSETYGAKLMKEIKESDEEIGQKYEGLITKKMTQHEYENLILIHRLVKNYFEIIRKSVQDHTPKQIYSKLIHYVEENLQNELSLHLLNSDMDVLFRENEKVTKRRVEMENRLEALTNAKKIIDELFNSTF